MPRHGPDDCTAAHNQRIAAISYVPTPTRPGAGALSPPLGMMRPCDAAARSPMPSSPPVSRGRSRRGRPRRMRRNGASVTAAGWVPAGHPAATAILAQLGLVQPDGGLGPGVVVRVAARADRAERAAASASIGSDLPRWRPPRRSPAIRCVVTRTTRSPALSRSASIRRVRWRQSSTAHRRCAHAPAQGTNSRCPSVVARTVLVASCRPTGPWRRPCASPCGHRSRS